MDPPSVCPYCDSPELRYSYSRADPNADLALLMFTCRGCGSHIEGYASGFEPPADDPRWTIDTIPHQRTPR